MTEQPWLPVLQTPDDDAYNFTEGDKAIAIAELGLQFELDDWQKWLIRRILQTDADGNFRFRQYLVSMGRQNGKTTLSSVILLYFLLAQPMQSTLMCLASTTAQANIVYKRLANLINSNPALKARFKPTTETRGITTKTGTSLQIAPAKGDALQGYSTRLVILDEGHLLPEATWDAVLVGSSMVPNSLNLMITTAGSEQSVLLKRLYSQARLGQSGLGASIWEAPEELDYSDDKNLATGLYAANPSLYAGRMDIDRAVEECRSVPESEMIRYRLNRFVAAENPFLPASLWLNCEQSVPSNKPLKIAIDIAPGWTAASIACAWEEDGKIHTDLICSVVKPRFDKFYDLIEAVFQQNSISEVAINTYAGNEIYTKMKERGIKTYKILKRDDYSAPALFYGALADGRICKPKNDLLDYQMLRVTRKEQGNDYRLIKPSNEVDIDAAMATVYASYLVLIEDRETVQVF